MPESPIVNLPFTPPNLVGPYTPPALDSVQDTTAAQTNSGIVNFEAQLKQATSPSAFKPAFDVPQTGRYPIYYPGHDNEEMYAQSQGALEKIGNGVVKFGGKALNTFVEGTAGLVYGTYKAIADGKMSSFYNNPLTQQLDTWDKGLEDKFSHYYTQRETQGNWWEPSNLFTGNFFWDKVVKNLGYSAGAFASGFAVAGALKATSLVGKLASVGKGWEAAELLAQEAAYAPKATKLSSSVQKLEDLWNASKSTAGKALQKADQFIVASAGSIGEGSMEAYNNMQEYRKNMVQQYKDKYGVAPSDSDLASINDYSEKVGNFSLGMNVALLTATNYVQLPKIFSSTFKGERSSLTNMAYRAGEDIWTSTLPQQSGKLLTKAANVASLFFNPVEAFEEGSQFAIQTGTENYFSEKYKNNSKGGFVDNILGLMLSKEGVTAYGVSQALRTNEGLENIFLGGFSGALQSMRGNIKERGITGYGGQQAALRDEAIGAWNKSTFQSKLKTSLEGLRRAETAQNLRQKSIGIFSRAKIVNLILLMNI